MLEQDICGCARNVVRQHFIPITKAGKRGAGKLKKWEERLEKMNDYDKGYLITGIEDGWIDPNMDDWHIYCKLKGIDEHPILTWLKKIVGVFGRK